jgi:hypothetical protein
MKFVFVRTGSIIESSNPFVIEQMKNSSAYKEYTEIKEVTKTPRKTKKSKED